MYPPKLNLWATTHDNSRRAIPGDCRKNSTAYVWLGDQSGFCSDLRVSLRESESSTARFLTRSKKKKTAKRNEPRWKSDILFRCHWSFYADSTYSQVHQVHIVSILHSTTPIPSETELDQSRFNTNYNHGY